MSRRGRRCASRSAARRRSCSSAGSSRSSSARWCSALVARGVAREARAQRAADLAALAGARAMHDAYARLFEPVFADRARPDPRHLEQGAYLALGRGGGRARSRRPTAPARARRVPGRATRSRPSACGSPCATASRSATGDARRTRRSRRAPRRSSRRPGRARGRRAAATPARSPTARASAMRPDVARAFDRMERAARADGVALIDHQRASAPTPSRPCSSPRHPDPSWVAPPGSSLHRLGTELDLGPPARVRLAGGATPRASTSSSATRGSPGTSATR